ncbi:hypothetical protein QJS66_01460 [Kocuria rhizophila]|nr:hypothetical protein QJS66_01460 [Kocuria rhizophila]
MERVPDDAPSPARRVHAYQEGGAGPLDDRVLPGARRGSGAPGPDAGDVPDPEPSVPAGDRGSSTSPRRAPRRSSAP